MITGSEPDDTTAVVPSFSVLEHVSDHIAFEFNHLYRYQLSPQDELQVSIRSVRQRANPELAALLLQFEMTGDTTDKSRDDVSEWFIQAHEKITEVFVGITDPEIRKQYWGSNE